MDMSSGLLIKGGDSCSGAAVQIPAWNTGWTFFHINLLYNYTISFKRPKMVNFNKKIEDGLY